MAAGSTFTPWGTADLACKWPALELGRETSWPGFLQYIWWLHLLLWWKQLSSNAFELTNERGDPASKEILRLSGIPLPKLHLDSHVRARITHAHTSFYNKV